jgi:hypothetical protein
VPVRPTETNRCLRAPGRQGFTAPTSPNTSTGSTLQLDRPRDPTPLAPDCGVLTRKPVHSHDFRLGPATVQPKTGHRGAEQVRAGSRMSVTVGPVMPSCSNGSETHGVRPMTAPKTQRLAVSSVATFVGDSLWPSSRNDAGRQEEVP